MKLTWIQALKKWNEQGSGTWCVPRKDSQGYTEVKALMAGVEKKTQEKKKREKKKEIKADGAIHANGVDITIDMFSNVGNLRDALASYHSNMSQPIGYLKKLNRAQLEEDIKNNRVPLIELKKYYNVNFGIPLPPKRIYTPYIESVPANLRRRF
jgi:hypothetical protein